MESLELDNEQMDENCLFKAIIIVTLDGLETPCVTVAIMNRIFRNRTELELHSKSEFSSSVFSVDADL